MDLRPLGPYKYFHSYSAGIDFTRQILTTKVGPRAVRFNLLYCYLSSFAAGTQFAAANDEK